MAGSDHDGPVRDPQESERQRLLAFVRDSRELLALAPESVLFRQGDPCTGCYYIEEGELLLSITSGERQLNLGSAKAGHLVGVAFVVGNCECRFSAQALRDSKLTFIPADELKDYLRQRSDICLATVEQLGADLLELTEHAIRPLRLPHKNPKH